MKKLLLLFLSFITIGNAQTELEEKKEVLRIIKQYTQTIACNTTFEENKTTEQLLKNVYTIARNAKPGGTIYYIFWGGDVGCMRGSGTYGYQVTEISRILPDYPFLVQNDEVAAFGEAWFGINQRFVESIKMIKPNHFVVVSSEFAEDDANCCPSKKYEYHLERKDIFSSWKITKSIRINKTKQK